MPPRTGAYVRLSISCALYAHRKGVRNQTLTRLEGRSCNHVHVCIMQPEVPSRLPVVSHQAELLLIDTAVNSFSLTEKGVKNGTQKRAHTCRRISILTCTKRHRHWHAWWGRCAAKTVVVTRLRGIFQNACVLYM